MNPETLLTILARARRELSTAPNTPFVERTVDRSHSTLSYPTFPDGAFSVDADMHSALQMLVQWGYLTQSEQPKGSAYLITAAGLSFAARSDGTWDGTERRQIDRRSGARRPSGAENRRVERRLSVVPV